MKEYRMKISIEELEDLSKKALSKYGYSEAESKIILDMLMYAQTRGNDQGTVKLIGEGIPKNKKPKSQGVQVADGLGYDKHGNETANPAEIMEGAIRPFDRGFKGAGLALMVQIIGGALVGGLSRRAPRHQTAGLSERPARTLSRLV
jgi:LDH2 family malate/lactate/ureidoglycolate dehydrogenase